MDEVLVFLLRYRILFAEIFGNGSKAENQEGILAFHIQPVDLPEWIESLVKAPLNREASLSFPEIDQILMGLSPWYAAWPWMLRMFELNRARHEENAYPGNLKERLREATEKLNAAST